MVQPVSIRLARLIFCPKLVLRLSGIYQTANKKVDHYTQDFFSTFIFSDVDRFGRDVRL